MTFTGMALPVVMPSNSTPPESHLLTRVTIQARMHGNKPSRGAEVDAKIQAEEEEELRRKGKA